MFRNIMFLLCSQFWLFRFSLISGVTSRQCPVLFCKAPSRLFWQTEFRMESWAPCEQNDCPVRTHMNSTKGAIHISIPGMMQKLRISKRISTKQNRMCRLDETWHVPCQHWGPRRNVSPCAVGLSSPIFLVQGCLDSTTEGCSRVHTPCPPCRFRKKREERTSTKNTAQEQPERQERDRHAQLGITIYGLDDKEGGLWLTRRLRQWREKKKIASEKMEGGPLMFKGTEEISVDTGHKKGWVQRTTE